MNDPQGSDSLDKRQSARLSRGRDGVNVPLAVDAWSSNAIAHAMTDQTIDKAIARIDQALARIERASIRQPTSTSGDTRYQALRTRTQAALASLETVIAQAGGRS